MLDVLLFLSWQGKPRAQRQKTQFYRVKTDNYCSKLRCIISFSYPLFFVNYPHLESSLIN
ncbi:hypothetical protein E2C01_031342 [Portunus trituberculatus]|uniref:Uncharacterized protein n=1 Tax=Portunus trituberculatus TaxID=210409 RepID=A0A5B7EXE9_PORTR|nr:hypothetical protein [Portunus trituberculatus]